MFSSIPPPYGPSPSKAPLWTRSARKWKSLAVPKSRFEHALNRPEFKHKTRHFLKHGYDKKYTKSYNYDDYKNELHTMWLSNALDAMEQGNTKAGEKILNTRLGNTSIDEVTNVFGHHFVLDYLAKMAKRGIKHYDYDNIKVLTWRGSEQDLDTYEIYDIMLNEMLKYPAREAFYFAYGVYLWLKAIGLYSKGTSPRILRYIKDSTLDAVEEIPDESESEDWEKVHQVLQAIDRKVTNALSA